MDVSAVMIYTSCFARRYSSERGTRKPQSESRPLWVSQSYVARKIRTTWKKMRRISMKYCSISSDSTVHRESLGHFFRQRVTYSSK